MIQSVSLTLFLAGYFYLLLSVTTVLVLFVYCLRHRSLAAPTAIPCATAVWYKVYTGFIMAAMLGLCTVAALETRKESNGSYNTFPKGFSRPVSSK